MKRIAVFASGGGSDMQSVIDGCESGKINGEVVVVITNKPDIYALERAAKHNIPAFVYRGKDYSDLVARDEDILTKLDEMRVDLIVLAGYLSIVSENIVKKYERRIINIHPSLIPKHCGMGYYGMRVHQSVIAAGDKMSGATVHFVDEGADTGEIIRQVTVPVFEGDTPEQLQKRVLEEEHKLLPQVVAELCKEN